MIRKMIYYFTLIGGLQLAGSCSEDNEPIPGLEVDKVWYKNPSIKIVGKYDVISFQSEKPVDLNGDSIYSSDLLAEADEWKNSDRYFLEFYNEQQVSDPTLFVPKLNVWVPRPGLILENNSEFILLRGYGFANLLARCYYSEPTNRIVIWNGTAHAGIVLSAEVSENRIMVTFLQEYYILNEKYYSEKGWEKLKIIATYEKRK